MKEGSVGSRFNPRKRGRARELSSRNKLYHHHVSKGCSWHKPPQDSISRIWLIIWTCLLFTQKGSKVAKLSSFDLFDSDGVNKHHFGYLWKKKSVWDSKRIWFLNERKREHEVFMKNKYPRRPWKLKFHSNDIWRRMFLWRHKTSIHVDDDEPN